MHEPSSKLSEEDLGNEGTEVCEAEPFETEPRKAKKTPKGRCSCSRSSHHSRCPNIESFATYFPRVLKQVHMGLSLSQEAVNLMNSFVMDMFEHIAEEAGHLARNNKRRTITHEDIEAAVRLLLPGDLCKYAINAATKSLIGYHTCR